MTGLIRAKFFLGDVFVAKAKLLLVREMIQGAQSSEMASMQRLNLKICLVVEAIASLY